MNSIKAKATIDTSVVFSLSEEEARALHDLTGYGAEAFYEKFCKELGSYYINKNKEGFFKLWERLRNELPREFYKLDKAREALK